MSLLTTLNAELNPICHLLALLGADHILHISGVRVKSTLFPAGNNTERRPHAGQASCQFHLPILYHHPDNAGCIVMAWVCGATFLLSDTQINIRQRRYIISLQSLSYLGRNRGLWSLSQIFNHPANQLTSGVSYSTGATMSWLWRITWKTNISHPSQFIYLYAPKGLYSSGILRSVYHYDVKDVSGKHIGPIFKGKAAQE